MIENIFDEKGNFIRKGFDPFRVTVENKDFYDLLFTEHYYSRGNLKEEVFQELIRFLHSHPNLSYFCQAVALYHAEIFARKTKGNYSTIYYWR